jgi:two-component system, chemotaxis family, sensor kinase CheA
LEKDRVAFLSESYELLNSLDSELIELGKNPESNDLLHSVHAHYQTFLESSKIQRYSKLESIVHIAERLISHLLQTDHEVSNEMSTTILKLNMSIREILFIIDDTGKEPDHLNESIINDVEAVINKTEDEGFMDEMGNTTDLLLAGSLPSTQNSHAELLDRFMNIVVELHNSKSIFDQFQKEFRSLSFLQETNRLSNLVSDLYSEIKNARSQPIGTLMMNFDKIIKDTAEPLTKQIILRVNGKEKELDNILLESLKQSLMQLIKNSVEHGIETEEERKSKGKNSEGLIIIDCHIKGEFFHSIYSDDGAGLDPEKIRQKFIDKNVMLSEEASQIPDNEIIHYIFKDGFAGFNELGGFIGGKPSGMDIAKVRLESIGGKIFLERNKPGKGLEIHLQIPMINSIIQVVSANFGIERYAIPKIYLLEVIHIDTENLLKKLEIEHGYTFFPWKDKRIPILYMKQILKYEEPITDKLPENPIVNLLVLDNDGKHFAMVADSVSDIEEVILKPLGPQLNDIFLFSGVTILQDTKPALILNTTEIYNHYLGNPILKKLVNREEVPKEFRKLDEEIQNEIDAPLLDKVLS